MKALMSDNLEFIAGFFETLPWIWPLKLPKSLPMKSPLVSQMIWSTTKFSTNDIFIGITVGLQTKVTYNIGIFRKEMKIISENSEQYLRGEEERADEDLSHFLFEKWSKKFSFIFLCYHYISVAMTEETSSRCLVCWTFNHSWTRSRTLTVTSTLSLANYRTLQKETGISSLIQKPVQTLLEWLAEWQLNHPEMHSLR